MKTICGIDCSECGFIENCGGCKATNAHPFGSSCMIAECCISNGFNHCDKSCSSACRLKAQLIEEFNALGIEDMEEVKNLNALKGSFVNLEYTLPSGQVIKFWDDNKIYLGNQICKKNSNRCYGLTADENYILVCEYGDYGANPEIVAFRKRILHSEINKPNDYTMSANKQLLLDNIDKVHTTEMGIERIRKNLGLDIDDAVEYCKNKILDKNCNIYKQGKNWYCEIDNIKITINSYSYTIITAHKLKEKNIC